MDFTDVNLFDVDFYTIAPFDAMVGIYDKRFLMIYQGGSILICKFDPDLELKSFNKNFSPYKSIYFHEDKYKSIFNYFSFKNYDKLEKISDSNLVDLFKIYQRDYIIDQIINN